MKQKYDQDEHSNQVENVQFFSHNYPEWKQIGSTIWIEKIIQR
jgi:hypothetical protein